VRAVQLLTSLGSVHRVRIGTDGRRKFGVPPGGPFDADAARLANALVGQPAGAAVWELALASATFVAETDGYVAAVGATASFTVGSLVGTTNAVRRVRSGESVAIGMPSDGCRVYCQWSTVGREGRIDYSPVPRANVNVIEGPDAQLFPRGWPDSIQLSPLMNRVGIRTRSDEMLVHDLKLPSKPQVVGSGQVTPKGELIIIGPDGPVTGGYPQILAVTRESISAVAQWTPGQAIRLQTVSVEAARELWQRKEALMLDRLKEIRAGLATP